MIMREARELLGYSLADLEEKTGLTESYLRTVETTGITPGNRSARKLRRLLGKDLEFHPVPTDYKSIQERRRDLDSAVKELKKVAPRAKEPYKSKSREKES